MKILLFGKDGQVGKHIYEIIKQKFIIRALNKKQCNFLNSKIVKRYIIKFKPDIIINTVAYTKVDLAEKNKDLCYKINSYALKDLAKIAKRKKIYLIHFSTDYIFDGEKNKPYAEYDKTNPLNVYGKSKLLGEKFLKKFSKKFLVIRTSWIFSNYSSNFLNNILNLMRSEENISIINDQIGSPTSAEFLSEMVLHILNKYKKYSKCKSLYGVYNIASRKYHGTNLLQQF